MSNFGCVRLYVLIARQYHELRRRAASLCVSSWSQRHCHERILSANLDEGLSTTATVTLSGLVKTASAIVMLTSIIYSVG